MITTVIAGLMALTMLQQTDTTFNVASGSRLRLSTQGGEIEVGTWDRDAVRVKAQHSSHTDVVIERSGSVVTVRSKGQFGPGGIVNYELTVPRSMAVDLAGLHSDITVTGLNADVNARAVQGDVEIRNTKGRVSAQSVNGDVAIRGAQGYVDAKSVSGDVTLTDISGDVSAETVSGTVDLRSIAASMVRASAVSGDLRYTGAIRDRGRYSFVAHSGNVLLDIPQKVNASFSVATMSGQVHAEGMKVTLPPTRPGRRINFTVGSGSATVEAESFNGEIRIGPNATRGN